MSGYHHRSFLLRMLVNAVAAARSVYVPAISSENTHNFSDIFAIMLCALLAAEFAAHFFGDAVAELFYVAAEHLGLGFEAHCGGGLL